MADLKHVYLLVGTDRPKIEAALARLRGHFAAEAVEMVSAVDTSGADAAAHCNVGSLFGDARLVVVEAVDGRRTAEGHLAGGWKAADHEAVVAYLRSPAPATVLALVAEALKDDTPLAKACARHGDVLRWNVDRKRLGSWVAERFRQRDVPADAEACALLAQLVGDDLVALAAEVDKVSTWAAGEPVGEPEIGRLVAAAADTPLWAVTDAWGKRDVARVLAESETFVERAGRPVGVAVSMIAGALTRQVALVRRAKRLDEQGVRPRDAMKDLGVRLEFQAQRAFAAARSFSVGELEEATLRLAALDLALKGGSRLPPALELQRALVDVTREADSRRGR